MKPRPVAKIIAKTRESEHHVEAAPLQDGAESPVQVWSPVFRLRLVAYVKINCLGSFGYVLSSVEAEDSVRGYDR